MRKTIVTSLAVLFVAAALAPAGAWAQNVALPAAAPTAQATPPAAAVPGKTTGKRFMTNRASKFQNRHYRHYRNVHWRTAGNGIRATNMNGAANVNHAALHKARTATSSKPTTSKSGTSFVGTTATKGTHHKAMAEKAKPMTGTKHETPKSTGAKT